MKTSTKIEIFSGAIEISPSRMRALRDRHYTMWLFCEIYTDSKTLPSHKDAVLNLAYALANSSTRCLSGADIMLIDGIPLFAPWVQVYHQYFFEDSKWNK